MAEENRYPINDTEGYSPFTGGGIAGAGQYAWDKLKNQWMPEIVAETAALPGTVLQGIHDIIGIKKPSAAYGYDEPNYLDFYRKVYGSSPKLDNTRYRWTMPMPPRPQDEIAPIQIPTPAPTSGRMVAQPGTPFYTNINPETGENDPNRIWASNTKTGALTQMPLGEEDVSQFVGGQRIFGSPNTPGGRALTREEWANVLKVPPTGRYIGDEGKDIPKEKEESRKAPQSYQDKVNRINEITNEVITWARKSPLNQKYAESELEVRLRDENLYNIKEPKLIDLSELSKMMDMFKEPIIDHSDPMNPKVTGYTINWAKYSVFARQYGLPSIQGRDEILMEKERRAGSGKEKPKPEDKGRSNSTGKVR